MRLIRFGYNKQRGFTLIELVLVIVLISILSVIGGQMLAQCLNYFITTQNITTANQQGQLAMEVMTREIRYVRSTADIITNTAGEFKFNDIYGNTIDYKLTGTNLMRNANILATGVNTLTFTYSNAAGGIVSGTAVGVIYVTFKINMTLNNTNYNLITSVYLGDITT